MGTVKYSGPVASFHCPTEATIRSLKVHFSPKQLGEGTPSPENVREIEGWDGVEVQRCGENLFPAATYTRTASGITFTYYPNGDVHIEGTATTATWLNVPTSMYFTIFPGTYTISGNKNNSNVLIYLVVSKDNGGDIKFYTSDDIPSSKIINFTDNQARVQIAVSGGKTVNVTVHPRLEKGNYTELETTEYEFGVLGKNKVPFLVDSKTISSQINGNAGWCNAWKIPNKNLKYTYSAYIDNTNNTNTANITVWLKNIDNTSYVDGTAKSGTQIAAGAVGRSTITLDASTLSNTYYFVFGITSFIKSGETASCTFSNPMVEIGDTATTYEPYDPNKTVYGGWVDLVSGEVCEEYNCIDLGTLNYTLRSNIGIGQFSANIGTQIGMLLQAKNLWAGCCSSYKYVGSYNDLKSVDKGVGYIYTTYVDVKDLSVTEDDASAIKSALNGVMLAYELATPKTYHLAPAQLQTFLGHNNIWSNADYVEVEYDLHETQDILARKQFITANQPHVVKPAAAPLQNFVTDVAAPLKECKIYFMPVQEGEGDPSPENIRPINGWNGLELTRCGVNLFDRNNFIMKQYYFTNNTKPIATEQSQRSRTAIIPCLPNTTYTVYKEASENNRFAIGCSDHICEIGETLTVATYTTAQSGKRLVLTTDETAKYLYIRYRNGYIYSDDGYNSEEEKLESLLGSLSVELGNNPESFDQHVYKSYNGTTIPITFPSEAGTVYGGYIDLIKGELIQTHKKVTVADLSWRTVTNLGAGGWATFSQTPSDISRASTIISNSYKTSTTRGSWSQYQNDDDYIISKYAPSDNLCIVIRDSRYETTEDFITNQGNAEIIYELASPIHYILTPQTLKTLRGTNNIWSNSNGDVTVQFWRH